MIQRHITKTIKSPINNLLGIITDVEKYPQFVKWCIETKVLSQIDANQFAASLSFGYNAFNYKYTSLVKWGTNANGTILLTATSQDGPFTDMKNTWLLTPLAHNITQINFDICFKLKNSLLAIPAKMAIDHVSQSIVSYFENRALILQDNFIR